VKVRLGEVASILAKQVDPRQAEYATLPLINGENIESGTTRLLFRRTAADQGVISGKYLVATGDVIYSKLRPYLRKVVVATEPGLCSADSYPLRPDLRVLDPQWLAWMLVSNRFTRYATDASARARMPKLNREQLFAYEFQLPAPDVQRRTAAQLSDQLAAASRTRDLASERKPTVGLLRRRVLDDTFATAVATGQTSRALRDVLQPRNEITHPRDDPTGDAMFVGLEHIESNTGRRIGGQTIRLEDLTGRKARFHPRDIVYGYLRPYLNKVWLADSVGFCSVDQYVFKVNPSKADAEYLAQFMRSSHYLSSAPIESTPGQLPRIRTEEVLAVPVPLPELGVQRRMAANLRRHLAMIDAMEASIRAEQEAIEALPAALLGRAFDDVAV
jgi:restriction endonuclease S subunit